MTTTHWRWPLAAILLALSGLHAAPGFAGPLTLEETLSLATRTSPELAAAQARIEAADGAAGQAGRWPNPKLGVGVSDGLGKELQTGGTEVTEITLAQTLPIGGRLGHAAEAAQSRLEAARARAQAERLALEYAITRRYSDVQLQQARMALASRWLAEADAIQHIGERRAAAGDLSNLERLRLELVREQAHQHQQTVESEYEDALARLRPYLPADARPRLEAVAPLDAPPAIAPLTQWRERQTGHPGLRAAEFDLAAAHTEIRAARAARLADWEIAFTQGREAIAGQEETVSTLNLTIPLPLWDRRGGDIRRATGEASVRRAELEQRQRDLGAELQTAYQHLGHVRQQLAHFERHVMSPAERVFDLTRTGFIAGEVDLLALIDATRSYLDASERRLELLHAMHLELAALRHAAGQSLLDTTDAPLGAARSHE